MSQVLGPGGYGTRTDASASDSDLIVPTENFGWQFDRYFGIPAISVTKLPVDAAHRG